MKEITSLTMPSVARIEAKPKTHKAASLFSGCGGGSLGLRMAGFDVLYANEFVESARKSYKLNSKLKPDGRDIRTVKPAEILEACGVEKGELDLLEGSPPCSAFSKARVHERGKSDFGKAKKYSDGKHQVVDDLFFEYTRLLKALQPKSFIAENVQGLTQGRNQGYYLDILKKLKSCGYNVKSAIIDPSWLGVPQRRLRLIFIGVRKDLDLEPQFPTPYSTLCTVKSCLPYVHQIKGAKKRFMSAASNPNPTITASDHSVTMTAEYSAGGWIETLDGEVRKYTIDELKVISGVPKDFRLHGTFNEQWERLGRIHSSLAVYHIAKKLKEVIS